MSPRSAPKPRRGRPPLDWIHGEAVARVAVGTALAIETTGHTARLLGRVLGHQPAAVRLRTPTGEVTITHLALKRARVVPGLYEAGDAVVRVGVDVATWRGGVVEVAGEEVLVEQISGAFDWIHERELEPAESRDPQPPRLRTGPVPARVS